MPKPKAPVLVTPNPTMDKFMDLTVVWGMSAQLAGAPNDASLGLAVMMQAAMLGVVAPTFVRAVLDIRNRALGYEAGYDAFAPARELCRQYDIEVG